MKKIIFCCSLLLGLHYGFSQKIATTLQYVVNQPTQKSTKVPVLIMLHGYGSNEADLFDISKTLDARLMTFSLRAPVELGQDQYCWYDLIGTPGQTRTYDYKQAKAAAAKVLSFISNACKTYHLDSTQVFVMGFSQGAILAYDLAVSAPKKIRGILALSGRMMEETKSLQADWTQVAKVKFFVAHGTSDNMIKFTDAEKAAEFLKEKKITQVVFKQYEMPHTISGAELNDMRTWLAKAIAPVASKPAVK